MNRLWSKETTIGAAIMLIILVAGCVPTPTALPPTATQPPSTATQPPPTETPIPPTPTPDPQALIIAWHEAFNNKDIDAFMAMVADDAVLERGPYGIVTGKERIRETVLIEMEQDIRAVVSHFEIEGNTITYRWKVYERGRVVDRGVGIAIIENGKIKSDIVPK